MKKLLFFLFGMMSLISVSAQQMDRVKATIETLCAPDMYGRGYTRQGDKKAAEYIAGRFSQAGLKSFTAKNNSSNPYFQPFNLNVNTFPDKVELSADGAALKPGEDFIVSSFSMSGKGSCEVYLLDTGLFFADKQAMQTLLATNLKNKAVVYHDSDQGKLLLLPQPLIRKIFEAKILIRLCNKLTMSIADQGTSQPNFELLSSRFNPAWKKIQFRVDAQPIQNYTTQNVIGYIEGRVKPDSFVVFSAHYDHLGQMGKDTYFPGANDNASGISMLLELADHYSKNKPAYSVVFMAFGAEEAGLIGSKYYTENPLFPLKKIKFLINMDLVGTGDDGMTVVNATLFTREFDLLDKINKEKGYLPKITKRGEAANSDHYFFSKKQVRAFFVYTLGGIQAYHDVFDRAATLPLTRYKEVFALLTDFVESL